MFEQTSMYNHIAYSMLDTHNICTSYAIHFAMIPYILHKMWTIFLFLCFWFDELILVLQNFIYYDIANRSLWKWKMSCSYVWNWLQRFIYLHENDTKCIFLLFRQVYILVDFRVLEKGNRWKVLLKCIDH